MNFTIFFSVRVRRFIFLLSFQLQSSILILRTLHDQSFDLFYYIVFSVDVFFWCFFFHFPFHWMHLKLQCNRHVVSMVDNAESILTNAGLSAYISSWDFNINQFSRPELLSILVSFTDSKYIVIKVNWIMFVLDWICDEQNSLQQISTLNLTEWVNGHSFYH